MGGREKSNNKIRNTPVFRSPITLRWDERPVPRLCHKVNILTSQPSRCPAVKPSIDAILETISIGIQNGTKPADQPPISDIGRRTVRCPDCGTSTTICKCFPRKACRLDCKRSGKGQGLGSKIQSDIQNQQISRRAHRS